LHLYPFVVYVAEKPQSAQLCGLGRRKRARRRNRKEEREKTKSEEKKTEKNRKLKGR
jgi:hypothetical protein